MSLRWSRGYGSGQQVTLAHALQLSVYMNNPNGTWGWFARVNDRKLTAQFKTMEEAKQGAERLARRIIVEAMAELTGEPTDAALGAQRGKA